jgi:predicted extracellular nuclease
VKSAKKHSILFYNVENLYDIHDDKKVSDFEFTPHGDKNWNEHKYQRKLKALANAILNTSSKHPIIAGLTEVENRRVLEDLILKTDLSKFHYSILHQDSSDNRGIDLCLIYDNNYVKRLSHYYVRIEFPWNRDIKTRDVLFFRAEINKENFWIIVNHWPSRKNGASETEDKRIQVAKEVRKQIDKIQYDFPVDKILIMGDFNDEPRNRSIEQILKAKRSKNIKVDEFYNLMTEADKKGEGTSTHMGEWLMIDQMMVNRNFLQNNNEGLGVKNQKASIFTSHGVLYCRPNGNCKPNQTYGGDNYMGGVSDHLPIFIELD